MTPRTATFFELIREPLAEVESHLRDTSPHHHPNLGLAIEHLLSSGGKRIRPAVALLAAQLLGLQDERTVVMAAAIEMLHTATLVHDDLIDGAKLRRGIPTLNAQWSPGATVLAGDYLFARAAELAAQTGSLAVMNAFALTLQTIVNGEISQLFRPSQDMDRSEYFARIHAKTASLFEMASRGPALLAEADEETAAALECYGREMGLAFQIMDDVLDFVGEQERMGKPIGSDLQHGLITLPSLIYLEMHPEDPDLRSVRKDDRIDESSLARLVAAIRDSGAAQKAQEEARQLAASAISRLEIFPPSDARDALRELTNYVTLRSL